MCAISAINVCCLAQRANRPGAQRNSSCSRQFTTNALYVNRRQRSYAKVRALFFPLQSLYKYTRHRVYIVFRPLNTRSTVTDNTATTAAACRFPESEHVVITQKRVAFPAILIDNATGLCSRVYKIYSSVHPCTRIL